MEISPKQIAKLKPHRLKNTNNITVPSLCGKLSYITAAAKFT
jgi:hypothetical protein